MGYIGVISLLSKSPDPPSEVQAGRRQSSGLLGLGLRGV